MSGAPIPRKILVLNERDLENPLAGGAEVHVFEIFSRLVERGHEVTLLAASFPGASKEAFVSGIRVRRLANRYLYYAIAPWVARRTFHREGFDIVVDVLNKLPFLSPWFVGGPVLGIVHHLFGETAFRQVSWPVALITRAAEFLIPAAYRSTPMLAISPSTKADLCGRGIDAGLVRVVPPGDDHSGKSNAAACGAPQGGPRGKTILWIGRMEPYKRADVLLDAIPEIRRRVPQAEFVFIGEGSVRASLEDECRRRGIADSVRFTGFVDETVKSELLSTATVIVNTSEKEGWGLTVIEGNAFGVPSVSSDVPGLRDSTRDGQTGLLYPFADCGALADAVSRVLIDEDLYDRLSHAARDWAEKFTWDAVAADVEALVEAALDPAAPAPRLTSSPFEG